MKGLIPQDVIEKKIYLIRSQKMMLSTDLAELYDVEPKVLIQAVKRNIERFPEDFMFQLTNQEFANLKSQFVTSSWGGIRRATPYAFTEQGVAMLSSVLKSKRAVQVNIAIMRAFVKLREMIASHKDLSKRLDDLENKYDVQFRVVFDAIRELMSPPETHKKKIGFHAKESSVRYKRSRSHLPAWRDTQPIPSPPRGRGGSEGEGLPR
ncbi:MAG: ORF6N domain-containing protein [bacterium]